MEHGACIRSARPRQPLRERPRNSVQLHRHSRKARGFLMARNSDDLLRDILQGASDVAEYVSVIEYVTFVALPRGMLERQCCGHAGRGAVPQAGPCRRDRFLADRRPVQRRLQRRQADPEVTCRTISAPYETRSDPERDRPHARTTPRPGAPDPDAAAGRRRDRLGRNLEDAGEGRRSLPRAGRFPQGRERGRAPHWIMRSTQGREEEGQRFGSSNRGDQRPHVRPRPFQRRSAHAAMRPGLWYAFCDPAL
ncbi:hypothetical protein ACVWXM_001556 [Bradyrhizobium sp. GM7.3]